MEKLYTPQIWPGDNTTWEFEDLVRIDNLNLVYSQTINNRPQWKYIRLITLEKFIKENKELNRAAKKIAEIRNVSVSQNIPEFILKEFIIMLIQHSVFSIKDLEKLILKNERAIYQAAELRKESKAIAINKSAVISEVLSFIKMVEKNKALNHPS